jgi:hypothetical protein
MLNSISNALASTVPVPLLSGTGGVPPISYPPKIPTPPTPPTQAHCLNLESNASLWNQIQLADLTCIFNRVYNAAILSVGAGFLIWTIISGIRYMAATGDEKAVADARRSLTMAVLGFVLVIAAYAVIKILGNVLGVVGIPIFVIPSP